MHHTKGCALKPHYTFQEQFQLHACVLLAVSTVCAFLDTKELSIQAGRSQMHKTVGLHQTQGKVVMLERVFNVDIV